MIAGLTEHSVTIDGQIVTASYAYPATIGEALAHWKVDSLLTPSVAFPAGTSVSAITYNGTPVPVSNLDLEGLTSVYLSQLINEAAPTRTFITGQAGLTDVWTFTIGNTSELDFTLKVEGVISEDNFVHSKVFVEDILSINLAAQE